MGFEDIVFFMQMAMWLSANWVISRRRKDDDNNVLMLKRAPTMRPLEKKLYFRVTD